MIQNKPEEKLYLIKLLFEPNKEENNLNFSSICKFVRQTFNVTQLAMAKRLGVPLSGYQSWEQGKREPSSRAAANLCFLYLQCLYINKETPKMTEINSLVDSVLSEETSGLEKTHQDTLVA